ncbi:MAG: type II secretion system F family protein [Actinomycetales bacterium]|nr:type II secretion system F family protein [Actinomycetales bacterium]
MSSLIASNLFALLAALLAAGAVWFLVSSLIRTFSPSGSRALVAALPKYVNRSHDGREAANVVAAPTGGSLFLKIGRALLTERYGKWLNDKLAETGSRGNLALEALLSKKVMFAIFGAMFGFLFFTKSAEFGIGAIVLLPVLGFFVPDLLVVSDGQKRVQALDLGLPDAIDLLNLCVESGLSFENGISRVSVSLNGPVAEEFGGLMAEIQLGKSRVDAMAQLSERTKSKGLQRFLSALLQVDRLGVPISGVLAEQASEMRAVRKDKAREQGQKVTINILMPLMFCFLPAMFIIVLGPAIVQLVKTMSLL